MKQPGRSCMETGMKPAGKLLNRLVGWSVVELLEKPSWRGYVAPGWGLAQGTGMLAGVTHCGMSSPVSRGTVLVRPGINKCQAAPASTTLLCAAFYRLPPLAEEEQRAIACKGSCHSRCRFVLKIRLNRFCKNTVYTIWQVRDV